MDISLGLLVSLVVGQSHPAPPCMPPYVDEHIVYFPSGDATLDLNRAWRVALASDALEHGVARVRLMAYADTAGDPAANLALSKRRGQAVADELVRLGVPRETITIEARGETNLARPTADDVPEIFNRRVVIAWDGGDSGLMDRLHAAYCPPGHYPLRPTFARFGGLAYGLRRGMSDRVNGEPRMRFANWIRAGAIALAGLAATACASYPTEPVYSTRPMAGYGGNQPAQPGYPAPPGYSPPAYTPPGVQPPTYESPPPLTAPTERIDGGALPPPSSGSNNYPAPAYNPPAYNPPAYNPPAPATSPSYATPSAPMSVSAGAAYVIQPGDTISGVGRRFQTPVQNLIDLNGLGPRGAITVGQSIILPDSALDTGSDPYATGPAPVGVRVPEDGRIPPPPPPPSGNPAAPPPAREPAATSPTGVAPAGSTMMQWPVRGEVLRRFGPVGMGERNNGINIGAAAGAAVGAAAGGRVSYIGDDLPGQGLTVLITHRDGWRTVYGHLGSATVRDGDDVRAGEQIGTVGLTAGDGRPSIHFETRRMQGDQPTAIDPLTVLPR